MSKEYPKTRNASAQAWRRLRKNLGAGEPKGLAADIAAIIEAESGTASTAASIEFALVEFNWDTKRQA